VFAVRAAGHQSPWCAECREEASGEGQQGAMRAFAL